MGELLSAGCAVLPGARTGVLLRDKLWMRDRLVLRMKQIFVLVNQFLYIVMVCSSVFLFRESSKV